MRVMKQSTRQLYGTHKGAELQIEREPDGRFYIIVRHADGGLLYDGWAPDDVRTIRAAKAEAVCGACL